MSAQVSSVVQLNGVRCFYKSTSQDKPISLIVKKNQNKHLFEALTGSIPHDLISLIATYAPRKMKMSLASFPALRKQAEDTFKKHNITLDWNAPIHWTFAALSLNPRAVLPALLHIKFQPGYTYYFFSQNTFPIERQVWRNQHPNWTAKSLEVATQSFMASNLDCDFLPWIRISLDSRPMIVEANAQVDGVPLGLHVDTWVVRCKDARVVDSHLFTHARIPIPHPAIDSKLYGEIQYHQRVPLGGPSVVHAIAQNVRQERKAAEKALSQATRAELNAVMEQRMAQHAAALKIMSKLPTQLSENVQKLDIQYNTETKCGYLE